MDCLFCEIFSRKSTSLSTAHWYNTPIYETDDFVAVPALGQIIVGYLLIVPRMHIYSMAQLDYNLRLKLYDFTKDVIKLQTVTWGFPTLFEHGSCHTNSVAGACIAHAHWHLVPGKWNLIPENLTKYRVYNSFEEFVQSEEQIYPYLFVTDSEFKYHFFNGSNIPSQLLRKMLASAVGKQDEWDYLVFPFFDNIRELYKQLGITTEINE